MKKIILFLTLSIFAAEALAQKAVSNFLESKQAYFGQTPPTEIPTVFVPKMLVDSGIVMGSVAFSNDGKEFYYTYAQSWFSRANSGIKKRIFDGQNWSKPIPIVETLNNPSLSSDETTLYFGGRSSQVWQAKKINGKWTEPTFWLSKPYGLYNFKSTASGVFYVGSNAHQGSKSDFSTYDICTLTISKTDTIIQSLGTPVNTKGFEGDFYIAPDESYLILSAKETPTFESELYISFRKADKTWTNPKSLGPAINDGLAHRFGQSVTPDNKYLIYTKGTSEKDCNFYWVRFDTMLARLRRTNYAPYVKNQIPDQTGQIGQSFSLRIPDNCFVDDDGNHTLTYSIKSGTGEPLPTWLQFNTAQKTLSGKPTMQGRYQLTVTATDSAHEVATLSFPLVINE